MRIDDLTTPALLVDAGALERNPGACRRRRARDATARRTSNRDP